MTSARNAQSKLLRVVTATAAVVGVLTGVKAKAQDPFKPVPVAPPCPASINRGAQQALDNYMDKVISEGQNKMFQLRMERTKISGNGESTSGIDMRIRLSEDTIRYERRVALANKQAELTAFALKKYRCEPAIFYFVP